MRTTVDMDQDLIAALKELAQRQGVSMGQVVSDLARQSLAAESTPRVRNGVRLFPKDSSASRPNMELVNALRDEG